MKIPMLRAMQINSVDYRNFASNELRELGRKFALLILTGCPCDFFQGLLAGLADWCLDEKGGSSMNKYIELGEALKNFLRKC